jgi:pimeloyl-ACP methyl ester carboxylesterase
MAHVDNSGVRIHYELEGNGPPLVLHPGFSMCSEDWRDFGQVEVLKRDHQLILVDSRGVGASDKPHDPAAYEIPLIVSDFTAVLDDLGLRQASYYGHSYGGWLGWGLAKHAPERFNSLILSGTHPYAVGSGMRDLLQQGPDAFLTAVDKIYGPYMTPSRRTRLAANDFKALSAMARDRPSLEDVLPTMHMPSLLIVGENDSRRPLVEECMKRMPQVELLLLPGCDHSATFGRIDLALPQVTRFLAGIHARMPIARSAT